VKLLVVIHRALAILAVAGLILAPLAGPSMAMPSQMDSAMSEHAAPEAITSMAMPHGDMPCCPQDKTPASDSGKDCPLMALCTASLLRPAALDAPERVLALLGIVVPGNDADLGSLAQAPPPRPPRA
jgi:hypothetical protein